MLYWKPEYLVETTASDAGFWTGSERSRTAYTTLKAAVLAPIPSASETQAVAKKAGFLTNRRSAYLRSMCPLDGSVSRRVGSRNGLDGWAVAASGTARKVRADCSNRLQSKAGP